MSHSTLASLILWPVSIKLVRIQCHFDETFALCRSGEASADDFVSEASSTLAGLVRRGSSGTGGTRDSSSDGGDEWDVERRAALKADRAAAEAAWGAHVAENDIGVLRWKAVRLPLNLFAGPVFL